MKITFHGHACFELESSGHRIIIDPWLTGNPLAKAKPEGISPEAILVSHGHWDHLGDAVAIATKSGATIIGVAELCHYCQGLGAKTHSMHIGGSFRFPFGKVKLTPALHGSAVMGDDGARYTGNPCGFIIEMGGKTVYHAGDTGLFGDMQLIGKQFSLDVALLPIGDNFVMGPEDAAVAVEMLRPKMVVPMHYNTFDVIRQDPETFRKAVKTRGLTQVVVLEPGGSYSI